MPAPRKRPDQRQDNRRSRGVAVVPVVPSDEVAEIGAPSPQKHWLKKTRDGWTDFWASEVAPALTRSDWPAVERVFEMRDLHERALRAYRKDPIVAGSMSQPVTNPAFAEAMKLETAITSLEDRYGLSPKARANLGIAIGQAKLTATEVNRRRQEAADDDDHEEDVIDVEEADLLEEFSG